MSDDRVLRLGPSPGDKIYLILGRAIASQCPAGFDEARLSVEPGGQGFALALVSVHGEQAESPGTIAPEAEAEIRQILQHIRETTPDEQGRVWRGCTVTLRKGGRFQMDVNY